MAAIETQSLRPLWPNLKEFKWLRVFGPQCRVSIAMTFASHGMSLRFILSSSLLNLVEIQLVNCKEAVELKYVRPWLTGAVLFAIPWSIGGLLESESRLKFDTFLRYLISGKDTAHPFPATFPPKMETLFPMDLTVYDWFYELKGKGMWRSWNELTRGFESPSHTDIRRIIIPTVDTARWVRLFVTSPCQGAFSNWIVCDLLGTRI